MTDKTDIKALRAEIDAPGKGSVLELRTIARRLLDQLEAEHQRAEDWKRVVDLRDSEIADLKDKLAMPVSLPKAAYFNSSAENLPFFRAFQVIEAIHKVGFLTVTYED